MVTVNKSTKGKMKNIVLTGIVESAIDGEHAYVCVGPNCWGASEATPTEALRRAKQNAPSGYRGPFLTRVAHKSFAVDAIDGAIAWDASHVAATCPLCTVGKVRLAIN
jgi:hypothetical protein